MTDERDKLADSLKETRERLSAIEPRIVTSSASSQRREALSDILPEGSTLAPAAGSHREANAFFGGGLPAGSSLSSGGAGSTMFHAQRPIMPEFDSQDREQYPRDRQKANFYWRLFHKYDPIFGNAIDMFAEMLVSDFDIVVKGDDSHVIKETLDYMVSEVNLLDVLKYMIREYLVLGECIPQNFFSDEKGIWTYTGFHNPDFIEIKDTPIIKMDPIINFVPDDSLRTMLTDGSPESMELRQKLPGQFVSKVVSRQKIRLSPVNCSFIARKLHPYDIRGTSLASRLWRIWVVEDASYNSTIATYRRMAQPIRVVKLGDAASGWIPDPAQEAKLLRLLAQAENDPGCFVPTTPVVMQDYTLKAIGDLVVGDKLLNRHGLPCEVEVLQNEETDELTHLDVSGTEDIVCTPDHKWPIWGGPRECMCGCGEPVVNGNFVYLHSAGYMSRKGIRSLEYGERLKDAPVKVNECKVRFLKGFDPYQKVEASKIRRGDYLMIPRKFEVITPSDVTPEKARLLGYYVAERNTKLIYKREDGSERIGVEFSLCEDEKDTLARDISEIIVKLVGYEPKIKPGNRNNCQVYAFRNDSTELALWLEGHGGKYAKHKKLSAEVMSWPLELKYEFLKGYLRGDGSNAVTIKDSSLRATVASSASKSLIYQLRVIVAQFGYYANTYDLIQSEKSLGPGKPIYRLSINGEFASQLSKDVFGVDCGITKDKRYGRQWWVDEDYVYVKVKATKKEMLTKPTRVVNMTVSGDRSYQACSFGTYNSVLVWNYGINFESWGSSDRAVNIKNDYDTIEKVKLSALGLSKSFLSGEVSYSSAKSGLQVFLRRLLSFRQYLESIWIYPKFFKPISEMNDWRKAKPSEVQHRYRMKRTSQEDAVAEESRLIMPELVWRNKLDPKLDSDLLKALKDLEQGFGVKISKVTASSTAGVDWKEEYEGHLKEFKEGQEIKEKILGKTKAKEYDEKEEAGAGAKPPGGPGGGAKPPGADKKPDGGGGPTGPGSADKNVTLDDGLEGPGEGGMPDTIE